MSQYKRILFASDLSKESEGLGQKAKDLANVFQAELSIVHVIEHSPMVYGSGEFAIPLDLDLEETLEKEARQALNEQALKLGIPEDHRWLLVGSKKQEIIKVAEDANIDLIVVGAHDKHGLALLFSSTTDSILHALPCDILSIRVEDE